MNYENLLREMRSLAEHVSYPITNLSNASALLFEEMEHLNWAGFYIRQGGTLSGTVSGKGSLYEDSAGKRSLWDGGEERPDSACEGCP